MRGSIILPGKHAPRYPLDATAIQDSTILEREWEEFDAVAAVEFVLELDPVKTKSVQEGRETLHDQQHRN